MIQSFFPEHSGSFITQNVEIGCHGYLVAMVTEKKHEKWSLFCI